MASQKPKVFILLGRGGAGKTEVGSFFAKKSGLGVPVIELANVMRQWAKEGHPVAMKCAEAIKAGNYMPGEWSTQILNEYIQKNKLALRQGLIVDGFPRRLEDIPVFEEFARQHSLEVGGVINFAVSFPTSFSRQMQRKRETRQTIDARNQAFEEKETAVIEHYRRQKKLKTISTEPSRKVQVGKRELALRNRAFLQQYAGQLRKIIKGKIPIPRRRIR